MKEKIIEVLSQVLNVPVNESTSQDNCAEWDSLHHLNLIIELEMAFDVSFEPEEIAEMKSVEMIETMLKKKF